MDLYEESDFASPSALSAPGAHLRGDIRVARGPDRARVDSQDDDDSMFGSISDLTAALESDIDDPFADGALSQRSRAGRESALAGVPAAFFEPATTRARNDAESGEISLVLDESAFAGEPTPRTPPRQLAPRQSRPRAQAAPSVEAVPLVDIPSGFFDRVVDERAIGFEVVGDVAPAATPPAAAPRRAPAPTTAGTPDLRPDDVSAVPGAPGRLDPGQLPSHRRRASVSYDEPLVIPKGIAAIKRPIAGSDSSGANARTARAAIAPPPPSSTAVEAAGEPRTEARHALAPQAPPTFPSLPPAPPAVDVPASIEDARTAVAPPAQGSAPAAAGAPARMERRMDTEPTNMVFGDMALGDPDDLTDVPALFPDRVHSARPAVSADTAQLVVPQLCAVSVDASADASVEELSGAPTLPDWDEVGGESGGDDPAAAGPRNSEQAVMARIQPRQAFRRVAPRN